MIGRNDPCPCGSKIKYKKCHMNTMEKLKEYENQGFLIPDISIIKNANQIEKIKESAKLNMQVLDEVAHKIKEGMSTLEIDEIVYDITTKGGGIPAPLNYESFPKSVCTSVNDVICHGIPSKDEILKEGDIINVDVSTIYNGFYSDSSRMFEIGNVSQNAKKLIETTRQCVELALEEARPWNFLGNIGYVINKHAMENGYSVVEDIGGHGVGLEFHEDPFVSYVSDKDTGMILAPGMIFTIEPMINEGSSNYTVDKKNGWTVRTKDHKLSAQIEYMILITEEGYEIISK